MKLTIEKVAATWRLKEAWNKVRKKGSAGGIDGVSIEEFERRAYDNIKQLSLDLLENRYIPEPLKAFDIKKPGKNEKRNLGLPSVKDKIVQASLSSLLSELYEPKFSNCSYAYRPGKGSVKAIGRVRDFLNRKNYWVCSVDIDDFFDTVNHDKTIEILCIFENL